MSYNCMQIESEIELLLEFGEKQNSRALYRATYTQIPSLLLIMVHILYANFCAISSSRNRDQCIPKISGKGKLQHHLLSDFHQHRHLCLDNTKYKILLNSAD